MTVRLETGSHIVRLRVAEPACAGDGDAYIAALEEVGRLRRPFVMLTTISVHLEMDHAQRKAQNLWFKASRQTMNTHCRALALIRLKPTEEMRRTFQGLWSFPVLVTADEGEAEAFLAARHPLEEPS